MYMVYSNSGQENTEKYGAASKANKLRKKKLKKNACKVGSDVIGYKSC